jgi:hypothetical protein
MTSYDDDTTETDVRIVAETKTTTKETVVDANIAVILLVRDPEPEPEPELGPTVLDVNLRALLAPATVPVDPDALTASVDVSGLVASELVAAAAKDDATLVDPVRPLPQATPTRSMTVGSGPAVKRFTVGE